MRSFAEPPPLQAPAQPTKTGKRMTRTQGLACTAGLLLLPLWGCNNPNDQPAGAGSPRIEGYLEGSVLSEASGLAPSLLNRGALWLNNDSGDTATLYQVGPDGKERGRLRVKDTPAKDWEDCASFTYQGRAWLLAADTGDNEETRTDYVLRVFPEPAPAELQPGRETLVEGGWSIRMRYPDGSHDCESVGVDASEGKIYFVSKRAIPHVLYSLPLKPNTDEEVVAERLGELAWLKPVTGLSATIPTPQGRYGNQPTGISFSQDGRLAVVLTYREAFLFRRMPGEKWKDILTKGGAPLPLHHLEQAEAICLSADGKAVYITGEGKRPALLRYELNRPE